jgi:hypothetical protein
MKNLSILLAIILVSSCTTQRRCLKKYPPEVKIERIVKDTTIYSDTIIEYILPTDTVLRVKLDTLYIPVGETFTYASDTLKAESNFAIAYTWLNLNQNTIQRSLKVVDKDTTLLIKLENAIRERDRLEKILKTETYIQPPLKKHIRRIKFQWLIYGLIIGFIIGLFINLRRK